MHRNWAQMDFFAHFKLYISNVHTETNPSEDCQRNGTLQWIHGKIDCVDTFRGFSSRVILSLSLNTFPQSYEICESATNPPNELRVLPHVDKITLGDLTNAFTQKFRVVLGKKTILDSFSKWPLDDIHELNLIFTNVDGLYRNESLIPVPTCTEVLD